MNKKQIIIVMVLALVVLGGIVLGIAMRNGKNKSVPAVSESTSTPLSPVTQTSTYTPEIPQNATLTVPVQQAPAAPNSPAKLGIFDMKITKNGFEPNTITVREGDRVTINLTAVDGNYDMLMGDFAYQSVKQGETKAINMQLAVSPGTYLFTCKNFCPQGGAIKGTMVVIPK